MSTRQWPWLFFSLRHRPVLSSVLPDNVATTEGAYGLSKPHCSMRTCFETCDVAVIVTATVVIAVRGVSRHRGTTLYNVETSDTKRVVATGVIHSFDYVFSGTCDSEASVSGQ